MLNIVILLVGVLATYRLAQIIGQDRISDPLRSWLGKLGTPLIITVYGPDFASGVVVRCNGVDRATTLVDSSTLTAAITAADVQNKTQVIVHNPATGEQAVVHTYVITAADGSPPKELSRFRRWIFYGAACVICLSVWAGIGIAYVLFISNSLVLKTIVYGIALSGGAVVLGGWLAAQNRSQK